MPAVQHDAVLTGDVFLRQDQGIGIVLDGWHYSTGPAFSETELSASVCRACRKIIVEYC